MNKPIQQKTYTYNTETDVAVREFNEAQLEEFNRYPKDNAFVPLVIENALYNRAKKLDIQDSKIFYVYRNGYKSWNESEVMFNNSDIAYLDLDENVDKQVQDFYQKEVSYGELNDVVGMINISDTVNCLHSDKDFYYVEAEVINDGTVKVETEKYNIYYTKAEFLEANMLYSIDLGTLTDGSEKQTQLVGLPIYSTFVYVENNNELLRYKQYHENEDVDFTIGSFIRVDIEPVKVQSGEVKADDHYTLADTQIIIQDKKTGVVLLFKK